MKQIDRIFFLTSQSDAEKTVRLVNQRQSNRSTLIISASPKVSLALIKSKLSFIDVGEFFPSASKNCRKLYRLAVKLASNWYRQKGLEERLKVRNVNLAKTLELPLAIFFGELIHSLELAKEILKLNPREIYINCRWLESPLKLYQSTEFSLENIALIELAKTRKIKLRFFNHPSGWRQRFPFLEVLIVSLCQLLLSIVRQFLPRTILPISKTMILANHYQLENLEPFLEFLVKNHKAVSVFGKTSPKHSANLKNMGIKFTLINTRTIPHLKLNRLYLIKFPLYLMAWFNAQKSLKEFLSSYIPFGWKITKYKLMFLIFTQLDLVEKYFKLGFSLAAKGATTLLTMASADVVSRSICLGFKNGGGKIIELNHGIMNITDLESPFRTNDLYAVSDKNVLRTIRAPLNKKTAVGFPLFEQFRTRKFREKLTESSLRHQFGIGKSSIVILILATFPVDLDLSRLSADSSPFQFMNTIITSLKTIRFSGTVIFRPHPGCHPVWVKQLFDANRIKFIYDHRQFDLDKVISTSNMIIGNITTALVHAAAAKKPIAVYTFNRHYLPELKRFPPVKMGAFRLFSDSRQLTSFLKRNLDSKPSPKMILAQTKYLLSFFENRDTSFNRLYKLIT